MLRGVLNEIIGTDKKLAYMAEECTGKVEEVVLKDLKLGRIEINHDDINKIDSIKLEEDLHRETLKR